MQGPEYGDGHWKLIFAGSRFTTDAESRYAPVEGEALALIYALQSCRIFVLGCPKLLVSVDHKPLVSIFGDQALEKISNPRLLNYKERSMMYRFTIKHIPGKRQVGPDATSCYPTMIQDSSQLCAILQKPTPLQYTPDTLTIDKPLHSSIAASYSEYENL